MISNKEKPIRRIPKSEKGEKTWKSLFESAQRIFLEKGYHKASVLAISKDAKVSPATFYQYFSSKNEIFEIILETFQNEFFNLLSSIIHSELTLEEKIKILINRVFDTFWNFRYEYKVFREAEFIDKELCLNFHLKIKAILENNPNSNSQSQDPDPFFWFLFGPLFYIAGYWILWNDSKVPEGTRETLLQFYLNGLSIRKFSVDEKVFSTLNAFRLDDENILNKGEQSKKRLLNSAELLFGEKGYFETTVHEICQQSNLSAGAFYLYFPGKQNVLSELIKKTSKELRFVLKKYSERFSDRRDMEIASLKGFLEFFKKHSNMYGVVRESEFIDNKITLEYYDSLKKPYIKVLDHAKEKGQIRDYDSETLSMILMGIGHLLGQSLLILSDKSSEKFENYLKPLSHLMMNGVSKNTPWNLVHKLHGIESESNSTTEK
jgi:AcrR family transcriptional regulator